jgi:hypothetical protein
MATNNTTSAKCSGDGDFTKYETRLFINNEVRSLSLVWT